MKNRFLDVLTSEGILADGAIGTEIYSRGVFINRCYDELNLANPGMIKDIHRAYLSAGSMLLKTNTFTANRPALATYGLEGKIEKINTEGVRLAREVAGENAYVGGSVGPISTSAGRLDARDAWLQIFAEQISLLAEGGADCILLETFTNLDEIEIAISAAKGATSLPVVAQVSAKRLSEEEYAGFTPEDAAERLASAGADVIGVNCADGPQGVFDSVKRMAAVTKLPLSAMPNAGMPRMVQGRMLYLATPEYMAEYARRYAQIGVALIGGCCGTTPAHIREMKKYLKAVKPTVRIEVKELKAEDARTEVEETPAGMKSAFGAVLGKKFAVSIEVDPPLGTDPSEAVAGAKLLKGLGVDAVNIADGPRAVPRMSPMALATIIKEKAGIETIVHYCCRDRNILGMQMDLFGASALGLNNILVITGDPPKMGQYPDATAVFDMDSIGLIRFAANLNRGLDFASRPIKNPTSLLIGCGVNPGAVDLDLEVERFRQKVGAGAEFAFSQPAYDMELLERFLSRIKDIRRIPFFAGILPLASLRNAEFLHNEVPGMQVPPDIMKRLAKEPAREGQRRVGMEVAREILKRAKAHPQIGGAYIFPPFGNYRLVEELLG